MEHQYNGNLPSRAACRFCLGSASRRQRSMKCSCDAELSFNSDARHLAMNAPGVIVSDGPVRGVGDVVRLFRLNGARAPAPIPCCLTSALKDAVPHRRLQDTSRDRGSPAMSVLRGSGVVSGSVSRAAMFHECAACITIDGSRAGVEAVGTLPAMTQGLPSSRGRSASTAALSGPSGTDRNVERQRTAIPSASDCLHVDLSRLLCDDGSSASCRGGTGKSQDNRGVDGWTATGLDAASRMRQEGRGLTST